MKKLILQLYLFIFLIPFIIANPDNFNETNKYSPLPSSQPSSQSPPSNINSIIVSTERASAFINPSNNKPYTFQNSVYSKPYTGYKFNASPSSVLSTSPSISSAYQTNFQPMAIQSGPTPVIMQYLPQSQIGGGIQYLQLIPTRPLIIPISPYITQPTAGTYPPQTSSNHLMGRSIIRSNDPIASSTSSHPLYTPGSLIGGYASNIPNFRYFRPNKGMEIIPGPDDLTFNTNEYLPAPNDSPTLNRVTRGKPR